jgi:hypothetical protein
MKIRHAASAVMKAITAAVIAILNVSIRLSTRHLASESADRNLRPLFNFRKGSFLWQGCARLLIG